MQLRSIQIDTTSSTGSARIRRVTAASLYPLPPQVTLSGRILLRIHFQNQQLVLSVHQINLVDLEVLHPLESLHSARADSVVLGDLANLHQLLHLESLRLEVPALGNQHLARRPRHHLPSLSLHNQQGHLGSRPNLLRPSDNLLSHPQALDSQHLVHLASGLTLPKILLRQPLLQVGSASLRRHLDNHLSQLQLSDSPVSLRLDSDNLRSQVLVSGNHPRLENLLLDKQRQRSGNHHSQLRASDRPRSPPHLRSVSLPIILPVSVNPRSQQRPGLGSLHLAQLLLHHLGNQVLRRTLSGPSPQKSRLKMKPWRQHLLQGRGRSPVPTLSRRRQLSHWRLSLPQHRSSRLSTHLLRRIL